MITEQVEEKVRETLRTVALDRVRAPGDLAEKVVRRRDRRRFSQIVGVVVAVAAITVGAVFGFGGGGAVDGDRPAAAPPKGWKPWQSGAPGASERGCLVDGSALYCAGSRYDAVKFDANTGERLWTVKVNGEGNGPDHPFAVRDGVVYAYRNHTSKKLPNGDYMGGTDLMAVDADTGDVLWAVEMPQDGRTDQAAMLIDGAVLANTPSVRTMSALDPLTGKEKWRHTWHKGIECQRAVLTDVPYLLCMRDVEGPADTDLFRLDPATGSARKVTTIPGRQGLIGTSGDRMILGEPKDVPGGDTLEDMAGRDIQLTTISSAGKQTSTSLQIDGVQASSGIIGDRLISVSWQGRASARSLTTGKTLWTRPVGVKMPGKDMITGIASPVESAKQGVVYFFSPTGELSGLDLRTGEQVWSGHVDTGEAGPVFGNSPQLLRYEDVLVARNGSRIVSFLPRIGD